MSRTRGPRKHLQHERRPVPLSQHAARLQSLQHLDARPGLDHVRICRGIGVPGQRAGRGPGAPGRRREIESMMRKAAVATCDFYLQSTPTDGVPYWDTGSPGLARLGDYQHRPADPYEWEPVDSSAAAIAAQGLLRLGRYLEPRRCGAWTALFPGWLDRPPHAAAAPLLESRRRPSGTVAARRLSPAARLGPCAGGPTIPHGESGLWGDYHLREAALYAQRLAEGKRDYTFFGGSRL